MENILFAARTCKVIFYVSSRMWVKIIVLGEKLKGWKRISECKWLEIHAMLHSIYDYNLWMENHTFYESSHFIRRVVNKTFKDDNFNLSLESWPITIRWDVKFHPSRYNYSDRWSGQFHFNRRHSQTRRQLNDYFVRDTRERGGKTNF